MLMIFPRCRRRWCAKKRVACTRSKLRTDLTMVGIACLQLGPPVRTLKETNAERSLDTRAEALHAALRGQHARWTRCFTHPSAK